MRVAASSSTRPSEAEQGAAAGGQLKRRHKSLSALPGAVSRMASSARNARAAAAHLSHPIRSDPIRFSRLARRMVAGLVCCVAGGHLLAAPCNARPLDEVKASNLLRVVVYERNRPFSWREGEQLVGVDVDLAAELARELGVGIEFIARMQGEDVDTDLRANVWKGPVLGGGVGDVMLHVPYDRELGVRNREAVLVNPYFEQRIVLAFDPARLGEVAGLDVFKREKVGVQLGTVSDYFIMFADGGAYRNNVLHFMRLDDGAKRYQGGEMAALFGIRSETEGWLAAVGAKGARYLEVPMPGIQRSRWNLGMAVKENSRDLGYALGAALDKIKAAGTLAAICARHGVTYAAPRLD